MKLVLQQKQQLNLVMTTELRQAIALLQHSTQDLHEYLKKEELENPLIELVEKEDNFSYSKSHRKVSQSNDDYVNPLDFIANKEKGIRDLLIEQVNLKKYTDETSARLNYLILNLDEKGYLSFKQAEIQEQLGINEPIFEELIQELQALEPIGIGARDLADCLQIQLEYYYPDESLAKKIVASYLTELADKKWHAIAKLENVSLEEIDSAFKIIQSLNPRPIGTEMMEEVTYVTPDIIVEYDNEIENFTIKLNDHYLPDLKFNQSYINENQQGNQLNEYVQEQYKKYQWLKNSIEQRRQTILKIIHILLDKQSDFFTNGLKALNPLTLKEVADLIDMHESTVSRATDNKIIQTPLGTFQLKNLFSTRLQTTSGGDMSQRQVKNVLKQIVDNEDKYKPLSDQKLADQMTKEFDIKISRRTIAKYRDELNILSSSKRKEIKINEHDK